MQQEPRYMSLAFIGHAIPYVCGPAVVVVMLLYTRSLSGGDAFEIDGPGSSTLTFNSTEGRIMLGLFEKTPRNWWSRRPRGLAGLNQTTDDYFGFVSDIWGWGFCVPHLVIVVLFLIPVAWWWIVFRHRDEELHRIEKGLCHNCGYDIRHSHGRCPECGEVQANVMWNEPVIPAKA
jgi:hypothetical protein